MPRSSLSGWVVTNPTVPVRPLLLLSHHSTSRASDHSCVRSPDSQFIQAVGSGMWRVTGSSAVPFHLSTTVHDGQSGRMYICSMVGI